MAGTSSPMASNIADDIPPLIIIANDIAVELDRPVPNETIQLCGLGPLSIIATHPNSVLELAREKLQTWQYSKVPIAWRRLYEDATLHLIVQELRNAEDLQGTIKRANSTEQYHQRIELFAKCVKLLDGVLIVAGAPGRRDYITRLFERFKPLIDELVGKGTSEPLHIRPPPFAVPTEHEVLRIEASMNFQAFQRHLDEDGIPIMIPGTFEHWPAKKLWKDIGYLRHRHLFGLRIVPVELGTSYIDDSWGQQLMTFNDFADKFLIPEEPAQIGYLAQHDLFTQIPELRNDVSIPDYCWTVPKAPSGAALETPGLADTPSLDEPNLNAWLGPKGTKTPLHTDPYHNIFCQVVGYKYVRLYPPEQRDNLYPCEPDSAGIEMNNTSQVDIFKHRPGRPNVMSVLTARHEELEKFPMLADAEYQETILGPGDCLYVPLGWWHYIEALTTSFSISFWWN